MMHPQNPDTLLNSFRSRRAYLKTMVLFVILMTAGAIFPSFLSAQNAMRLTIVNNSGYADDKVYFIMICQSPLGYLDFQTHTMVPTPSFSLDVTTMVATLAQLKQYSGDGTCSIPCPAMGSSRVYFCLGQNFDQMGGFAASGPEMGSSNPVPWGMFEVNLTDGKFVNQSNVDFFSIAYTLTVGALTVGIPTSSDAIFRDFEAISLSDIGQQNGNTAVFRSLIIKNSAGEIIRVIAPKAAALNVVNTGTLPQMFTHFLDDYVNNYCWKPSRTFSFSSKLSSDTATYYGKVNANGLTLSIYTDEAMTIPYKGLSLPRPSNSWGNPDFNAMPSYWHNVGVASTVPENIDWGYLLYGQDGYSTGPGAYWITDPVAMAIPVSIVRGVMHLDNGTADWKDSTKYYQGTNGASTSAFPIFYYGQILHRYGIAGRVYALSFDDVYGNDSGIGFTDPAVTITIYPFREVPSVPTGVAATKGAYTDRVRVSWNTVSNAITYEVYRNSANDSATASKLSTDAANSPFYDLTAAVNTTYYYWIKSRNATGASGFSVYASGWLACGRADFAMVSSTGIWRLWLSGSGYQPLDPVPLNVSGTPVAADFDRDGFADFAMVSSTGIWRLWLSGSGYQPLDPVPLNVSGTPVAADFDRDGFADFAMVSSTGVWRLWLSGSGYQPLDPVPLNVSGTPVAADFDGDGFTDFAMVSSTGVWRLWLSGMDYQMLDPIPLGVSGTPLAADFDGR